MRRSAWICFVVSAACLHAVPVSAQPVSAVVLDVTDAAGAASEFSRHPDWDAPPSLYWTGVALEVGVLAGGGYLLVQGVRALSVVDEAGLAAPVILILGGVLTLTAGTAVGLAATDLVRVLRGDDPALARLFDPTRPRPIPPRYPVPPPGTPD